MQFMQFHAMNMQCQDLVLYYLLFFLKNIFVFQHVSCFRKEKKETHFFIETHDLFFSEPGVFENVILNLAV